MTTGYSAGYTAKRTPVHKGQAAWSAILPGQPAPVSLAGDASVDVAIVGGGFSGTMVAANLARKGIRSVLIDGSGRAGHGEQGRPLGDPASGFQIQLAGQIVDVADRKPGGGQAACSACLANPPSTAAFRSANSRSAPRKTELHFCG